MNENLILYLLAGICIVASPVLFFVRDQMLRQLSPAQIKALLGAEEQVEVTTPKSTKLVMKFHYPAAFLLLAGVALAGSTLYISSLAGDAEWVILGSIRPPDGLDIGKVFDQGHLTLYPTDVAKSVTKNGFYEIKVKIPRSRTFEDEIAMIHYSLDVGDKSYFFDIRTKVSLDLYNTGDPTTSIENADSATRKYKPVSLRMVGEENR